MALALLPGDLLHVKPFHIVKPETAKLLFCEMALNADYRLSGVLIPVLLFDTCEVYDNV
jgi:hypothetical protein